MGKRERNSEMTKQALLDSAEIEFSQKGLYGARVDEIAARAKVNKGMIYLYFGSKEELYKSVLESVYCRLSQDESLVIQKKGNCLNEIAEIIRTYFYFLKENPAYVRMLMWENLNDGKYFAEKELGSVKNLIRSELKQMIESGKKSGEIAPKIDPDQILLSLIALSFNYFSNMYTLSEVYGKPMGEAENLEERIQSVTDMMLCYLKNDQRKK
jgi:TetR/AcrR family transcriptional regulator